MLAAALLVLITFVGLISCGGPFTGGRSDATKVLTSEQLWQINEDVLFTYFYYDDRHVESGLLLRWMPDSILIQERGEDLPRKIPSFGINRIETITGNKLFAGLSVGTLAGAAYFAAVRGDRLTGISFAAALAKLLVPPAMIITGMAIGSSMDTKDSYVVPPEFQFDYEAAKIIFQKKK
jgi:hypothetical protein